MPTPKRLRRCSPRAIGEIAPGPQISPRSSRTRPQSDPFCNSFAHRMAWKVSRRCVTADWWDSCWERLELGSPTGAWAGAMRPRSAEIPYAGFAADGDDGRLYRTMYAALAARWLTQGLTTHYITIPANRETAETWSDLGFGRFIEMGVRDTEPSAPANQSDVVDIEIRRATAADEDAMQMLMTELFRAWSSPPAFVPFLPETTAARRQFIAELLADPACPHWLAFAGDRVVGMQVFTEPASPHWFVSPLQSPPQSVYLFLASTMPEERGRGVGTALLAHTMGWAREAGYAALHGPLRHRDSGRRLLARAGVPARIALAFAYRRRARTLGTRTGIASRSLGRPTSHDLSTTIN